MASVKTSAIGGTQVNDFFGISGDTVVVGANGEESSTTGVNSTPNESAVGYGGVALDSSSAAKAFTVLKTGGEARTITCVSGVTGSTTFAVTLIARSTHPQAEATGR